MDSHAIGKLHYILNLKYYSPFFLTPQKIKHFIRENVLDVKSM